MSENQLRALKHLNKRSMTVTTLQCAQCSGSFSLSLSVIFFFSDYRCNLCRRCPFPVIYSSFPFLCFGSIPNQRNQSTSFHEECPIYFKQKKNKTKQVRKFSRSKEHKLGILGLTDRMKIENSKLFLL